MRDCTYSVATTLTLRVTLAVGVPVAAPDIEGDALRELEADFVALRDSDELREAKTDVEAAILTDAVADSVVLIVVATENDTEALTDSDDDGDAVVDELMDGDGLSLSVALIDGNDETLVDTDTDAEALTVAVGDADELCDCDFDGD